MAHFHQLKGTTQEFKQQMAGYSTEVIAMQPGEIKKSLKHYKAALPRGKSRGSQHARPYSSTANVLKI